jgi:hypothetical protein
MSVHEATGNEERTAADYVYGHSVYVDGDGRVERLLSHRIPQRRILREYGCYIPATPCLYADRSSGLHRASNREEDHGPGTGM